MTATDPPPATVLPFVVRLDEARTAEIEQVRSELAALETAARCLGSRLAELEARRGRRRRAGRRNGI
jgi:uncharacterized protein with von Willebrand factor type A (vWA) domain